VLGGVVMSLQFIPWDGSFEIHHELIDAQHKIFVMLLNKIMLKLSEDAPLETIQLYFEELRRYAEFHFLSEENVMRECRYPGTANHEQVHTEMLHKIDRFCNQLASGIGNVEEIVEFLKKWLFNHILLEDSLLSDYVREHQIAQG
jgi:hemerythrin